MMEDIRDRLLQRDYLYADAAAYRAGVEAAWAALADQQAPMQGAEDTRPDPWGMTVANG